MQTLLAQPNVIIFFTDDQGTLDTRAYGSKGPWKLIHVSGTESLVNLEDEKLKWKITSISAPNL